MEHQKILDLLNKARNSKFISRKQDIVKDPSNENYDPGNEIIYNTEVLKPNIFDYIDTFILVSGDITIIGDIFFQNTAQITLTQQTVYAFILKGKQLILILILRIQLFLSLSSIKPNQQDKQMLNTQKITAMEFQKM